MAVLNLAYQIFRFCVLSRGIPETNQLKTILHCNMFGKYTCGLLFFAGLFMTILLYGKQCVAEMVTFILLVLDAFAVTTLCLLTGLCLG